MTKDEMLETLKDMFVERFGVGTEVDVDKRITIGHSWDVGDTCLTKVRCNGNDFEYCEECWSSRWKDDARVFDKYGIAALSACLGVNVRTRTEYFIV